MISTTDESILHRFQSNFQKDTCIIEFDDGILSCNFIVFFVQVICLFSIMDVANAVVALSLALVPRTHHNSYTTMKSTRMYFCQVSLLQLGLLLAHPLDCIRIFSIFSNSCKELNHVREAYICTSFLFMLLSYLSKYCRTWLTAEHYVNYFKRVQHFGS